MTWALTSIGLLTLGLLGGGALAGSLGGLTRLVIVTGPQQFAGNPAVAVQAIQAVQNGAGWAALWLGVAVVAAVLGTGMGARLTSGTGLDDGGRDRGPVTSLDTRRRRTHAAPAARRSGSGVQVVRSGARQSGTRRWAPPASPGSYRSRTISAAM